MTQLRKAQTQQMGFDQAPPSTIKYWFVYSIQNFGSTNTIANAATGNGSVQIQSDSNFLLQQLCFLGRSAAGAIIADTALDVTIQLTDASSGATLFDQPQQIRCVAGDAKLPFVLPTPRVLVANSTVLCTLVNNSGGNLLPCISMHGRKIYGLR